MQLIETSIILTDGTRLQTAFQLGDRDICKLALLVQQNFPGARILRARWLTPVEGTIAA